MIFSNIERAGELAKILEEGPERLAALSKLGNHNKIRLYTKDHKDGGSGFDCVGAFPVSDLKGCIESEMSHCRAELSSMGVLFPVAAAPDAEYEL